MFESYIWEYDTAESCVEIAINNLAVSIVVTMSIITDRYSDSIAKNVLFI